MKKLKVTKTMIKRYKDDFGWVFETEDGVEYTYNGDFKDYTSALNDMIDMIKELGYEIPSKLLEED